MAGSNRIYVDLNDFLFEKVRRICFEQKITHKKLVEDALEEYFKSKERKVKQWKN